MNVRELEAYNLIRALVKEYPAVGAHAVFDGIDAALSEKSAALQRKDTALFAALALLDQKRVTEPNKQRMNFAIANGINPETTCELERGVLARARKMAEELDATKEPR